MRRRSIIWLIWLAAFDSAAIVLGQVAAPQSQPSPPTPAPPSSPGAPVAVDPAASQPAARPPLPSADRSGIAPASLPAVKNCMEHPQAWQKAIQGLMDKIDDAQLRQQLSEGLGNLAPRIASGLIDHRGDSAYVTLAVYRQAGEGGKQAAVALAFEGFGGRLDGTFYGRVLADMPRPPDTGDNSAPKGLLLDTSASCYLCFFISGDGLCAGPIPHETFKQELVAAFQQAGKTPPNVVADGEPAIQEAAVHEWLDQVVRQDIIQQQQAQLAAEEASAAYVPENNGLVAVEPYPPYYYGDWGLYGAGWYNPIIIVLHRPLHHDGDGHHWQNWNWRPYQLYQETSSQSHTVTATPPVTSDHGPPIPQGQTVSPANVPAEPYQAPPVFAEPVRQPAVGSSNAPIQQAAPGRSSGAPTGGTRTSGASGSSHPAGSSGGSSGAGHGGGPPRR